MIILAGTIRIPPENIERAAPHLEAIVKGTRSEPGCISYSFAWDVVDEGLIRIFEVFANEQALAAHRASAHMAAWRAVQPELGVGERNLTQYEISKSEKI
jgi:quinol monooxygenase YgiN